MGTLGADDDLVVASESDMYDELRSAPVSTPPRFFNLGMPPANKPPSCGAASMLAAAGPVSRLPWSLLLRNLLPPGTGGARPGTGGAPPTGGPPPPDALPVTGADRSFVTAFLSALPF